MVEERAHPDGPADVHGDDSLAHPSVRHERSDANFRWVVGLILAAIGLGILIHYGVFVFFVHYRDQQATIKRSAYPLAPVPRESLPPEPRLEQLDRVSG